jgi:hypothetical protein
MLTRPAKSEKDLTLEIDAFISHPNFDDVPSYHNLGGVTNTPQLTRNERRTHAKAVLMAVMLSVEELRGFVAWQPNTHPHSEPKRTFVDNAQYHGAHNALSANAPGVYQHLRQTMNEHLQIGPEPMGPERFALKTSSELDIFWTIRRLSRERKAIVSSLFHSNARKLAANPNWQQGNALPLQCALHRSACRTQESRPR